MANVDTLLDLDDPSSLPTTTHPSNSFDTANIDPVPVMDPFSTNYEVHLTHILVCYIIYRGQTDRQTGVNDRCPSVMRRGDVIT